MIKGSGISLKRKWLLPKLLCFFKWFRFKNKIDLESYLPVENQWAQLKKQQQSTDTCKEMQHI